MYLVVKQANHRGLSFQLDVSAVPALRVVCETSAYVAGSEQTSGPGYRPLRLHQVHQALVASQARVVSRKFRFESVQEIHPYRLLVVDLDNATLLQQAVSFG